MEVSLQSLKVTRDLIQIAFKEIIEPRITSSLYNVNANDKSSEEIKYLIRYFFESLDKNIQEIIDIKSNRILN